MASIKDYGGLKPYLNGTKGLHGGIDYDKFVTMVDDDVLDAEIVRKTKTGRTTIHRWKGILREERRATNVTASNK